MGGMSTLINCCTIRHTRIIDTLLGKRVSVGLVHVLNWYITMRSTVRPHYFLLSLWVTRVDTCSLWGYRDSVWHEVHGCKLIVLSGPFLTHVYADRQLAMVPIVLIHCYLLLERVFLLTDRLC